AEQASRDSGIPRPGRFRTGRSDRDELRPAGRKTGPPRIRAGMDGEERRAGGCMGNAMSTGTRERKRNRASMAAKHRGSVAAMLMLAFGLALPAVEAMAQTQVYDPQTRSWVDYDRTRAYQYYRQHEQVPE